jgi:hypothetical protein
LTSILPRRRDRIGATFLGRILPLDEFRLRRNSLEFDDLAVKFGLAMPREYRYEWFRFDNRTGRRMPVSGASAPAIPDGLAAD